MAGTLRTQHCNIKTKRIIGIGNIMCVMCDIDVFKVKNDCDYCPKKRNRYHFDYECIESVSVPDGSKVT